MQHRKHSQTNNYIRNVITCSKWTPSWGPNFLYNKKLPLNNDHLSTMGPEVVNCTQVWLYIFVLKIISKQQSLSPLFILVISSSLYKIVEQLWSEILLQMKIGFTFHLILQLKMWWIKSPAKQFEKLNPLNNSIIGAIQ